MLHVGREGIAPTGRPFRLLLVSDDPTIAEALRGHLGRHGFRVCQASSGRTAPHVVDDTYPDVVLIDAAVHGGWREAARSLEGHVPRGRIGVLAAYWSTAARREAIELGVGATFLKQLEGEDLVERLRALIDEAAPPAADPIEPDERARRRPPASVSRKAG